MLSAEPDSRGRHAAGARVTVLAEGCKLVAVLAVFVDAGGVVAGPDVAVAGGVGASGRPHVTAPRRSARSAAALLTPKSVLRAS